MSLGRLAKRRVEAAKRRIHQALSRGSSVPAAGRTRVDIAGRANVVTALNVGGPGSTRAVAASQRTRIRQVNGRTVEQTEARETEL